jgi:hypothetical protein
MVSLLPLLVVALVASSRLMEVVEGELIDGSLSRLHLSSTASLMGDECFAP